MIKMFYPSWGTTVNWHYQQSFYDYDDDQGDDDDVNEKIDDDDDKDNDKKVVTYPSRGTNSLPALWTGCGASKLHQTFLTSDDDDDDADGGVGADDDVECRWWQW